MCTELNIYRLYVGLNDAESKKQEISTKDAMNIISDYLANHFEGATVFPAIGVYKHPDSGIVVKEKSLVIELFFVSEMEVNDLLRFAKKALNQYSVAKMILNGTVSFE